MSATIDDTRTSLPPTGGELGLVRAVFPGVELRAATAKSASEMPTLTGHFSVFNRWTEIDSLWEGNFMERFSPGAFKKTFQEQRSKMRALFQHGRDPQVGDKPLGPIDVLREDGTGAYYEVPLLDTSYNRDLIPGLDAGLYGASFRFKVVREEVVDMPKPSANNPKGLPERTVKEAQVSEFGPVTFGAYPDATSGVRSLTDNFILEQLYQREPERFQMFVSRAVGIKEPDPRPGGPIVIPPGGPNVPPGAPPSPGRSATRADAEDMDTLACMIQCAADYITEQDETDDAANVTKMNTVLTTLGELMAVEAAETEPPDEPEDEEMNSASVEGETRDEETDESGEETTSTEATEEDATDEPRSTPLVGARQEGGAGLLHPATRSPQPPTSPIYGESRKERPSWQL